MSGKRESPQQQAARHYEQRTEHTLGTAGHGAARRGSARLGVARQVWHGTAGLGVAWRGEAGMENTKETPDQSRPGVFQWRGSNKTWAPELGP